MTHKSFRFGQWHVDPATNTLSSGELNRQLEPRAMDVLLHLARHPHTVISADDLLDACWGDTPASDNAVHKIITQLRRAFDDSASAPRYIETIRKRGYRLLAELSYDDDVSQGSWTHASPFRGLEAFEEQHAAIFFGRKLSVDRLVQVAIEQVQGACAMVLVLGPSGAGKTSLIQAGLIPALKAGATPAEADIAIGSHVQLDCADMGQSGLLETLASTLLDAELDDRLLFENTSAAALADYMARDLPGLIAHLQAQVPGIRLALFIDRFEAIFRLPHIGEHEREVFINVLDQLARSGTLLLILACRNDFYPHLTAYPALMNMKLRGGHFDLPPPGSADIAQIVRHPAQVAQLRYTVDEHGEGLDELLCSAAKAGPDTLPLLQYCLQELYRQRTPEGELTHAAFHQMGGLEGAIGARAEQVISALGPAQIAALPQLLSRLVLVAEDEATVTSRRVPWSALTNEDETRLVQALVDAHLFVSDLHGGAPAFGIAHEALLRRWPRVVAWVEEHRQALQTRSRISAQARRWQDSGRKRDMLLPSGTQANQARELIGTTALSFTVEERSFIDLSLAGARRAERLRVAIMVMITSLALLSAALGLSARAARLQAEQNRNDAESLTGYMLGEFVEKLRPLGKLELLDSISNRTLSYLSVSDRKEDSETSLIQRAKSLQLIAEVKIARADSAGAEKALLSGREILHQLLIKNPTDPILLKNSGENAFWLGQSYFGRNDWHNASFYLKSYKDFTDRLANSDPENIDTWLEQSYAHNSLGSLALQQSNPEIAAAEFSHSIELKHRALSKRRNEKNIIADLADSYSWLASTQAKQGLLHEADASYNQSASLLRSLNDNEPNEILWLKELTSLSIQHADVNQALGDILIAEKKLRYARSSLKKLSKSDPTNRSWQRNLYIAEYKLCILSNDASLSYIEKLEKEVDELRQLEKDTIGLTVASRISYCKAINYLKQGNHVKATASLHPFLAQLSDAYRLKPIDQDLRNTLLEVQLLQAKIAEISNNIKESHLICSAAQSLILPTIKESLDYRLLASWVKIQSCLGNIENSRKEIDTLERMNYKEPTYLNYTSNKSKKRASL